MTSAAIWWIRRDFRLIDNQALSAAIHCADSVLPVFIHDTGLEKRNAPMKSRFLESVIRGLSISIRSQGGTLLIRRGDPSKVLTQLVQEIQPAGIFAEADVTPYARKRDNEIAKILPLTLTAGLTAIPTELIHKSDGTPYTVFTPFSNTWKKLPQQSASFEQEPVQWANFPDMVSLPLPEVTPIYFADALQRLLEFTAEDIYNYQENRDRVDLDGTSELSAAFHFGLISASQARTLARSAMNKVELHERKRSAETWLNQIIWREFYNSILYHFPFVRNHPFREKYQGIQWREAPEELTAWQQGMTGYPIVDAAMRQMNQTGWMHNRARMISASFLVKDLLIDWRLGQEYFMRQLIDGDIANNNGGWQWVAGTGTDAAPYFRIFNPILQSKKFDPKGRYIRKYVPELSSVPDKFIHEPWKMSPHEQIKYGVTLDEIYPLPMVDHQFARARTLAAFKIEGA